MTRRRWVYTQGGRPLPEPIEVTAEWTDTPKRVDVVTDLYMDGVRATDGTDIGSRKKRREYMHVRGLADADDYKGQWQKAAEQREKVRRGEHDKAERRDAIGRAVYEAEKRGRR